MSILLGSCYKASAVKRTALLDGQTGFPNQIRKSCRSASHWLQYTYFRWQKLMCITRLGQYDCEPVNFMGATGYPFLVLALMSAILAAWWGMGDFCQSQKRESSMTSLELQWPSWPSANTPLAGSDTSCSMTEGRVAGAVCVTVSRSSLGLPNNVYSCIEGVEFLKIQAKDISVDEPEMCTVHQLGDLGQGQY